MKRAAGLVSGMTLLSRVLGLIRVGMIAKVFGVVVAIDCFLFAFALPNLMRQLFGEGALSAAFIPRFTQLNHDATRDKAQQLFSLVITHLSIILALLTVLGWCLFRFLDPGTLFFFLSETSLKELTMPGEVYGETLSGLLMILWPYMMLICFVAFFSAVLQSCRAFLMPALAPVVLNVFWIGGLCLVAWWPSHGVYVMAWAILLGGVVQLLCVGVPVMRRGFAFRFKWDYKHPELRSLLKIMIPVVIGLIPMQLSLFVDILLAENFIDSSGAVASLHYANRLLQFPLALIGIAIATVAFPQLSSEVISENKFGDTLKRGLRFLVFLGVPASLGLAYLAPEIIGLIYERGAFSSTETSRVAYVLRTYTWGLAPMCLLPLLTRAYYSKQNMHKPMRVAWIAIVLKVCLSVVLVRTHREIGLAAATSLVSWIQCGLLVGGLAAMAVPVWKGLREGLLKVVFASAGMCASLIVFDRVCSIELNLISAVLGKVALGMCVYVVLAKILVHPDSRHGKKADDTI